MKLTAFAVIILAFGIVAGFALAGSAPDTPVSAAPQCPGPSAQCATPPPTPTPAPPQLRQSEITFLTSTSAVFGTNLTYDSITGALAPINPDDFPAVTEFRFQVNGFQDEPPSSICFRLVEVIGAGVTAPPTITPVAGSEICGPSSGGYTSMTSPPMSLPSGANHLYTFQWREDVGGGNFLAGVIRVIAAWPE